MATSDTLWKWLDRLGILAMLVASALVVSRSGWVLVGEDSVTEIDAVGSNQNIEAVDGDIAPERLVPLWSQGMATASIAVVEFSDYHCPFCRQSASQLVPELVQRYVQTGVVKYFFVNFPLEGLHPTAVRAAEAAECAGKQGAYWPMHDLLFARPEASLEGQFGDYAMSLGMNLGSFEDCMATGMVEKIRAEIKLGHDLRVSSTPTYFIGSYDEGGGAQYRLRVRGARTRSVVAAIEQVSKR